MRDALGEALYRTGLSKATRRHRAQLLIVTFHRVLPESERRLYPYPGLVVTPEELDWFLTFFAEHYTPTSLAHAHQRWLAGESPDKPLLALTFDDGQLDNYKHARPVLSRHGLLASFFIPVEAVESGELLWHDRLGFAIRSSPEGAVRDAVESAGIRPGDYGDLLTTAVEGSKALNPADRSKLVESLIGAGSDTAPTWAAMMNWDQIRTLAGEGHEIGSHSMSHALLPQCSDEELERELKESRRILENRLDRTIDCMCYPNGDADMRVARHTEEAGYKVAVTTRWGSNAAGASPYLLRRCNMDASRVSSMAGRLSEARLALRLSGFLPGLRRSA